LQSFGDRQQRARHASLSDQAQQHAVCEAIDSLVHSVQFHDITRQQIEHVCQALQGVAADLAAFASPASPEGHRCHTVLKLQASQLEAAAGVFRTSVGQMEQNLDRIGARVADMAAASRGLMGFSEDERDAFFLRMESSFTGILKAVNSCEAAE